jgi:hypothetical protein
MGDRLTRCMNSCHRYAATIMATLFGTISIICGLFGGIRDVFGPIFTPDTWFASVLLTATISSASVAVAVVAYKRGNANGSRVMREHIISYGGPILDAVDQAHSRFAQETSK